MNYKTLGLVGLLLLLLGCNRQTTSDKEFVSPEFYKKYNLNRKTYNKISSDSFDGTWIDEAGPNLSFTISKDTIWNSEDSIKVKFQMNGDSATFFYPEVTIKIKMYKIHADTLVHEINGISNLYWRLNDLK